MGLTGRAAGRRYRSRPSILRALADHGLCPTWATAPVLVRDLLTDLSRDELGRLREQKRRSGPSGRKGLKSVFALRRKDALRSVSLVQWTDSPPRGGGRGRKHDAQ